MRERFVEGEERKFKSIRGSGEAKQIELFVGRDGTKCEKFNTVGLFIKDNGNGGGLSKFPALKIGLKDFFFSSHAVRAMTALTVVQDCILFAHNSGEDLAQGVGFWYAFLTSFWGPKTMVLSKREGLLPGPGLAL